MRYLAWCWKLPCSPVGDNCMLFAQEWSLAFLPQWLYYYLYFPDLGAGKARENIVKCECFLPEREPLGELKSSPFFQVVISDIFSSFLIVSPSSYLLSRLSFSPQGRCSKRALSPQTPKSSATLGSLTIPILFPYSRLHEENPPLLCLSFPHPYLSRASPAM